MSSSCHEHRKFTGAVLLAFSSWHEARVPEPEWARRSATLLRRNLRIRMAFRPRQQPLHRMTLPVKAQLGYQSQGYLILSAAVVQRTRANVPRVRASDEDDFFRWRGATSDTFLKRVRRPRTRTSYNTRNVEVDCDSAKAR